MNGGPCNGLTIVRIKQGGWMHESCAILQVNF